MKFGVFYEHQLPRPWDDGDEAKLLRDALEQGELADKRASMWCGRWSSTFSRSTRTRVHPRFLAAASQRTRQI